MIELCCEYLSVRCIWLYVFIMSRTRFRVNPYSIVAWMKYEAYQIWSLMHIHLSFIRNMRLSTTPYIWRTTFSIINIINNADKYLAFKYVFQLCLDNPTLSLTHAFLMKLEWICIKLHTWQVFFFSLILLWVKICNGFKKLGKKSSCISNTSRKFHFKSINVHDDDELKNGMVDQQKYASFDQRQRSSS